MSTVGRKWPKIDLINFIANNTYKDWNKYLAKCESDKNITSLVATYYGFQIGMQYAVKQKLNTPFVVNTFIRLQRSIEKTLKRIYKQTYNANYSGQDILTAKNVKDAVQKKKVTDNEFEKWLKLQRY